MFPQILKKCWLTLDKTHAISGFRKTGLYPVDRTAVKNKILRTASEVPVDGAGHSPGRLLRSAILKEITPKETPVKPKTRARVQSKIGEVLTEEVVLERLQKEQAEREKKKQKKSSEKSSEERSS